MKYLLLIVLFLFFIRTLLQMDFSESEEINVVMTEQEEAEIASFYSIDPESIVRGKSFDFKYAYLYQPDLYGYDSVIAPDAMSIEVVMKHNKTLKVGEVAFFYDNYKLIEYDYRDQDEQIVTVQENPGHLFSPLQPGADVNYQRLGQARNLLFYIYMMMNFEIEYGTGPFDISNLTFTIELKDSRSPFYRTESYDLIYNEERCLSETRKVKELCMSGTACNRYEKSKWVIILEYCFTKISINGIRKSKNLYLKQKNTMSIIL